jgi:hypothetical protein
MGTRGALRVAVVLILATCPIHPARSSTYSIRLGGARVGMLERTVQRPEAGPTIVREQTTIRMARGDRFIEMGEILTWIETTPQGLQSFGAERTGFGPERWLDTVTHTTSGWRRNRSRGGAGVIDTIGTGRRCGPLEIERLFAALPDSIRIRTIDSTTGELETYVASFVRADTLPARGARVPCRVYVLRDSSGTAPEVLQWRDAGGDLWKESDPTLGWVAERSELSPDSSESSQGSDLDVMRWLSVPLEGRRPRNGECVMIVEKSDGPAPDGAQPPIVEGPGQQVSPGPSPGAWTVRLRREPLPSDRPVDSSRWKQDRELSDALLPGLIIDSGNPRIVGFADQATAGITLPVAEALALERAVHAAIRTPDLGTVLGTASQTLRDGRGDCTEHAVLLAACCRARGIPARVVAGIVPNGDQMSFHLWTEAYVGRWISLDATRAVGSIDPCAVALERWTQPENGLAGFQISLERMTAGYRFRFAEE